MELPPPPDELFQGAPSFEETAARAGRWAVLNELGFFGDKTNLRLARGHYPGSFMAATRRTFSNTYGNTDGCHPADIEVAMELLGVLDDVLDVEAVKND